MSTPAFTPSRKQGGLTLIELLVAMAVSTIIALAAVSALTVSRVGFKSVDASSQLRDNTRFAVDLLQRLGNQAGYKDIAYAATPRPSNVAGVSNDPTPSVYGFNNSTPNATSPSFLAIARSPGVGYGSDMLVLRYQSPETFPGSGVADQSVIDCLGQPAAAGAIPTGRDNMLTSVLHVAVQRGEPALMCTTVDNQGVVSTARPIISGVENFQVLYGVDGVVAGTAPVQPVDSIADSFLRADQLTVPTDPAATNANWRRVRSLRIGMVLRAAPGSAADRDSQTFYPLGQTMWATADDGSKFVAPGDGRLRQAVTFTVHLRNAQDL